MPQGFFVAAFGRRPPDQFVRRPGIVQEQTMATESRLALAVTGHEMEQIVEFPLLLTTSQVEALSRASHNRGITAGQLARRAIDEFLSRRSASQLGRPSRGDSRPWADDDGT
jgi:hypothetical protein